MSTQASAESLESDSFSPLSRSSSSSLLERTNKNSFLDAEQAFRLTALITDNKEIIVQWQVAEGYYLYRDKLAFSVVAEGSIGKANYPTGIMKNDPTFGEVEVYQQSVVEITLPVLSIGHSKFLQLKVDYQGCAEAGLCYPPMSKTLDLEIPERLIPLKELQAKQEINQKSTTENATHAAAPIMISEQDKLAQTLMSGNSGYVILVFFGLGLLLSLTPCVFPMIPILSSLIAGQRNLSSLQAFKLSAIYVVSMAFAYSFAGVLAGLAGENLPANLQHPVVIIVFAMVFVALALSMFGFYELQLPSNWQTHLSKISQPELYHAHNEVETPRIATSWRSIAFMGFVSALIVSPCVAPPLAGALIYIAQTKDGILGGLALFSMGLGMGVPLLIIGTTTGNLLPRAGEWMDQVKTLFGVLLLAVSIWMLERILPNGLNLGLWAILCISSAVYLGALDNLAAGSSGWRRFWKGIGVALLIYGAILLAGMASGNSNPLQPLQTWAAQANAVNPQKGLEFQKIKGLAQLEHAIQQAKQRGQAVMVDVYADWCIACKELEVFTFNHHQVKESLKNFVLLQLDVTPNDEQDKAVYQRFNLFGPPAILFFDKQGQHQANFNIIGFIPAEAFLQHLQRFQQLMQ